MMLEGASRREILPLPNFKFGHEEGADLFFDSVTNALQIWYYKTGEPFMKNVRHEQNIIILTQTKNKNPFVESYIDCKYYQNIYVV